MIYFVLAVLVIIGIYTASRHLTVKKNIEFLNSLNFHDVFKAPAHPSHPVPNTKIFLFIKKDPEGKGWWVRESTPNFMNIRYGKGEKFEVKEPILITKSSGYLHVQLEKLGNEADNRKQMIDQVKEYEKHMIEITEKDEAFIL